MATMNMGYHYDMGKRIGYDIRVGNLYFSHVAYHSKGRLIYQLKRDGYKEEEIEVDRVVNERYEPQNRY